ncbi:MAG: hypothetical protein HQL72_14920 [Magnetococcales bacterium]|nr:hypothetical protein [Magnetococcales bacterium]
MKRDALLKLFRQGVVTDVWVSPFKGFFCVEYRLNNGDTGKLVGFDARVGIRKFRTINAACKAVHGLGVHPVRVHMEEVQANSFNKN